MKSSRSPRAALPKYPILWLLGVATLVFSMHGKSQTTTPPATQASEGAAAEGEKLYKKKCASCHDAQPGPPSPFAAPDLHGMFQDKSRMTPEEAEEIIKKGKNAMPAYEDTLAQADIHNLMAYLKALPLTETPVPPSQIQPAPSPQGPPPFRTLPHQQQTDTR